MQCGNVKGKRKVNYRRGSHHVGTIDRDLPMRRALRFMINHPAVAVVGSVYAITDVEAGRFSFAQIAGKEELVFEPHPKLRSTLFEAEHDQPRSLRLLTDAMTQAFQELTDPEPSVAARVEYMRLTGSDTLTSTTSDDGFLNIRQWIECEATENETDVQAFIGVSYIERNRKVFSTMLARTTMLEDLKDGEPVELVWFRPGGTAWGLTEDLRTMIGDIRAALRGSPG